MSEPITIESVAHHRNGVCGAPFFVVTFTAVVDPETTSRNFVATLFPNYDEVNDTYTWGPESDFAGLFTFTNPRCAVLDRDLLAQGDIAFGSNSWRGDRYATDLLAAVNAWDNLPFEEKFPDAGPRPDVEIVVLDLHAE